MAKLFVALTAAPARPEDAGTNVIRLPYRVMVRLGLTEGDLVEVAGETSAWGRSFSAHREDEGMDIVRVDAELDRHPDLEGAMKVKVSEARTRRARKLEVAVEDFDGLEEDDVREVLRGEPVLSGDRIRIDVEKDARTLEMGLSLVGLELVGVTGRQRTVEGGVLAVHSTHPPGPVSIVPDTVIRIAGASANEGSAGEVDRHGAAGDETDGEGADG